MDWSKIKEEPATDTSKTIADAAHDYCLALKKFDEAAPKCQHRIEGFCGKLPGWKCGILHCAYCTPIFMLYLEETKLND